MDSHDISTSGFISTGNTVTTPRFTDIEVIPTAGFNVVAKAKRYGRWWTLKGLKAKYKDEAHITLLKKEFDILIMMQHPGIVTATGFESVPGIGPCIVMEWIDGATLGKWITLPHTRKEKQDIALQIMDALEYVHGKQAAHRDLKPSNIMITRNGQHAKLIDFGLSDTDNYAIYKQPAGTDGYISPEQSTTNETDIRNDSYSLGCVLENMRLGFAFNHIVKRCKAKVSIRYRNIGEVRKAFKQRCHLRYKVAMVACIATILPGIAYMYQEVTSQHTRQPQTTANVASHTANNTPKDTLYIATEAKPDASTKQTKHDIQQNKQSDNYEKIEKAIKEGKRKMAQAAANYQLTEDMSYNECSSTYEKLTETLYKLWCDYPKELKYLSETEQETVRQVLATYYKDLVAPWYERLQKGNKPID